MTAEATFETVSDPKTYFFYGAGLKANDDDTVEGHIATDDQDLVDDIITPECMVDMVTQLKSRVIKIDYKHEAFRGKDELEREVNKTTTPVAKIEEARFDGHGIEVKDRLNKHHSKYAETKGSIKDGFLDAHSIAFIPRVYKFEVKDGKKVRMLHRLTLLNVAFTGNPVNPNASFSKVVLKSIDDNFGGGAMPENKDEDKAGNVEIKDKAEAKANDELKAEIKAVDAKVAELKDNITELTKELKAKVETKPPEEPKKKKEDEDEDAKKKSTKDLDAQLKAIQEKQAEIDKVLSSPQMKGRMSDATTAETKDRGAEVKDSKGPLDFAF